MKDLAPQRDSSGRSARGVSGRAGRRGRKSGVFVLGGGISLRNKKAEKRLEVNR